MIEFRQRGCENCAWHVMYEGHEICLRMYEEIKGWPKGETAILYDPAEHSAPDTIGPQASDAEDVMEICRTWNEEGHRFTNIARQQWARTDDYKMMRENLDKWLFGSIEQITAEALS